MKELNNWHLGKKAKNAVGHLKEIFIDPIRYPLEIYTSDYNVENDEQRFEGLSRQEFLLKPGIPTSLKLKAPLIELREIALHPTSKTTVTVNTARRTITTFSINKH